LLRWRRVLPGQHFHIYLMAYGVFRFFHEYLRATPVVFGPFSGYQVGALCVFLLGLAGFLKRRQDNLRPQPASI
jgi:phosphatidylglycerol:prolipoprotein diacylglycerol transferase